MLLSHSEHAGAAKNFDQLSVAARFRRNFHENVPAERQLQRPASQQQRQAGDRPRKVDLIKLYDFCFEKFYTF